MRFTFVVLSKMSKEHLKWVPFIFGTNFQYHHQVRISVRPILWSMTK